MSFKNVDPIINGCLKLNIFFFIFSERETETDKDLKFTGSFPKCMQQLELHQTEVKCLKLNMGLPVDISDLKSAFPGGWLQSEAELRP